MTDDPIVIWEAFWNRMRKLDDRQISDEAKWWSSDESTITELPDTKGAWLASMEIAFEAGRRWEREHEQ